MAATDFIHKTLINAGSRDAVSNMLTGAGVGAAANTAIGAAQGDFNVIGNATSGALLGAGAGAAARHFGAKYGSGLIAAREAGETVGTNFQVGMMTRKVEEPALDFWGKSGDSDSIKGFMPQGGAVKAGPKAGADTSGASTSTPASSTPPPLPDPFPNSAVPPPTRAPLPGIGSNFAGAGANTGSGFKSTYGGGNINYTSNTPMPARTPAPAVQRAPAVQEQDDVQRAMQRADEWTSNNNSRIAQEKAEEALRIKQEKADKKAYNNFLQNHTTKAKKNNELPSSSILDNAMSRTNTTRLGGVGRNPGAPTESYKSHKSLQESVQYNQQRNSQLEEQARAQMYGY